ncbi:MAG: phosphate regulon transcriptional regulatory protein PhoB [Piscirickettsiaceae bacterium CG_4_9_14_3_um_filter_43_564]|nr:phosphate regulon transcriptional regulatory protein PhoB [Thiomicrospira sp.]OIP95057.1 MAG: phosphate regulon transcriptional regulatory protein PhoB [Thiomicrospira sp. CG2_30_44_34]PIQ04112.1 MAG: phosphate regulon transcriptional regulatory protein PhoB [Piscirickettsiaceae bacterium CG18_big_fil_WC_8_21_14_2_50_44_103]PIU38771.1 MAG: phosphate regulon transcriptional regulatory protein PhoB [Piscirickettsiaceae bacterium CG07_land_8_20_14_0_80_44_28]PIW58685.1 MAG: phosphate regulon tr
MEETQCILVVEDEAAIRDMLSFTLTAANYRVLEAPNAEQGWQLLLEHKPDCVLLDWMLPGVSGLSLARRIRQHDQTRSTPIILLTARGEENDQVQGFEAGADDYVVKPFSPRALVARVQAILRRQTPDKLHSEMIQSGKLKLDLSSYRFTVSGQEVKLGPTEFKLMQFFMTHPNRVYTRLQLLDQVWGESVVVEERTVDVHIRRLRKLLDPVEAADVIQTVRGAGYRFSTE